MIFKELLTALAMPSQAWKCPDPPIWACLAYEGADKANVNQSLRPFAKIVEEDGQLVYLRVAINT